MSSNQPKRSRSRRPRNPLTLSWAGKGMLAFGLTLALLATLLGAGSVLIWADVGLCILLAATFFLLDLKICRSRGTKPSLAIRARERGGTSSWLNTALVLSALVTIFSPAVKAGVDIGKGALAGVRQDQRECKAVKPRSAHSF